MSHFKSKKTAPKKNNEPNLIEVNGRQYIMCPGNRVKAFLEPNSDVEKPDVRKVKNSSIATLLN